SGAPPTLTFVDLRRQTPLAKLQAPGRTRWATYHRHTDSFYVNIADPPCIISVRAGDTERIDRTIPIPSRGPHGLEQSQDGSRLYCACDDAALLEIDPATGEVEEIGHLAGAPDVLWSDPELGQLYAATDEEATVEVFGGDPPRRRQTYAT